MLVLQARTWARPAILNAAAAAAAATTARPPQQARGRAFSSSGTGGRRREQPSAAAPGNFGIVFDIDGVLVRGGKQIPGAKDVLEFLARAQSHPDPVKRVGGASGWFGVEDPGGS